MGTRNVDSFFGKDKLTSFSFPTIFASGKNPILFGEVYIQPDVKSMLNKSIKFIEKGGRLSSRPFKKFMENNENEFERRLAIISSLREKRARYLDKVGVREFRRWVDENIERIQTIYPDPVELEKYSLWHVFQGGGDQEDCEFFDLPGEASIQKIIEELPE